MEHLKEYNDDVRELINKYLTYITHSEWVEETKNKVRINQTLKSDIEGILNMHDCEYENGGIMISKMNRKWDEVEYYIDIKLDNIDYYYVSIVNVMSNEEYIIRCDGIEGLRVLASDEVYYFITKKGREYTPLYDAILEYYNIKNIILWED